MIVLFIFVVLVIVPALVAVLYDVSFSSGPGFAIGAPIVYSRRAISTQPVSGARNICPSERGEFYYYDLVNYLRVAEILDDGSIIAVARNQRRLCFSPKDSDFRKAGLVERFVYRWRFPHL